MNDITLEFEAEEYAVDGLLRREEEVVLRFWVESSGRLEIASNCCGAQVSRADHIDPLHCIKCKQPHAALPQPHAIREDYEAGLRDWTMEALSLNLLEASLLAIHIGLNVQALMEELAPLYSEPSATIAEEEAVWVRIAEIAHRERVLL